MAKRIGAVTLLNPFRGGNRRKSQNSSTEGGDKRAEAVEEAPPGAGRLDRLAERLSRFRSILFDSVVGFALVLALIIGIPTFLPEVFRDTAVIDPIRVPDNLANEGYWPEVISERLMDDVRKIRREAASRLEGQEIQPDWLQMDFELAGTGLSVASIVRIAKRFFGFSEIRVSGEIVADGDWYKLRLRFLPQGVHAETQLLAETDLDRLLHLGAREMMEVLDPYILAVYLAGAKEEDAALEAIALSLGNDSKVDDPYALAFWGWLLTGEARHDEAIKMYKEALDLDRKFVLAASNWGMTLTERNEPDKAIEQYQRALEWDDEFYPALNNWGVALLKKEEPENAIEKFREALEVEPKFVKAYRNWGLALYKLRRFEDAVDVYEEALLVDPLDSDTHRIWGDALLAIGDRDLKKDRDKASEHYRSAAEKYRNAADLNPNDARTHLNWGIVLSKLGQSGNAIERFKVSVALDSSSAKAYNSWGTVYLNQRKFPEAIRLYLIAIDKNPNLGPAHRNLGSAYLKLQECELAIQHLRKAVSIDEKTNSDLIENISQIEKVAQNKSVDSRCK